MSPQLLLTGGIVENMSVRTPASLIECKHRHQVCVATLAVVGAVAACGVARLLAAVASLDEGLIAVGIWHRVPCQRAVSLCQLHESQRLWWAGV